MARKTNALKLSPEACRQVTVGSRQPMPPTAALYLAQLRQHMLNVPPSGARQQIAIQIEEQSQAPRVVKIIHTGSI
jgi:hypothetical protein